MKILNFGSLNVDIVYEMDHLPRTGETVSTLTRTNFAGGKGLNQSIAMARAGTKVYHAGAIGDKEGQFLIDVLKQNQVNTDFIRVLPGETTGHAVIGVEASGQNRIVLFGGTNQKIGRSQVDETLQAFSAGDFLLLQNEISELGYIIDQAYQKGMTIILNPSPMDQTIKALDLTKISYLILNEIEGRDLSGESEPGPMLRTLLSRYPDLKVVLTLGSKGAIYKDRLQEVRQSAFPVKAVDTTGAGDTFTGYFFAALSQDKTIPEALLLASRAAAISVTRKGAEASIPRIEEVRAALAMKERTVS